MADLPPVGTGEEHELGAHNGRAWDEQTLAWRLHQFLRLDFPPRLAERLARSEAVVDDVAALLASGCPHDLAAKISI